MMKKILGLLSTILFPLLFSACGDDEPVPDRQDPNRPEKDKGIVLTVDDGGKAVGDHTFEIINERSY